MYEDFSQGALDAVSAATEDSRCRGHYFLGVEHLAAGLLSIKDSACQRALQACHINGTRWLDQIHRAPTWQQEPVWGRTFIRTPRFTRVVEIAAQVARRSHRHEVEPVHLLLALALEGGGSPVRALHALGCAPGDLIDSANAQASAQPKRVDTGPLQRFARDLCEAAELGQLPDISGRDAELLRLSQVLSRSRKGNVLLVGEAGVGKTGIVHAFAQLLISDRCPPALSGARIYELQPGALVGGTQFRGELEQRANELLKQLTADEHAIVFVDELHVLADRRGQPGLDLMDLLKPALSDGGLRMIAATTPREMARTIERDGALSRRFETIQVHEPDRAQVREMLDSVRKRLESHHGVRITTRALDRTLVLCERHLPHRCFPDKAIDVLDDACAQVRIRGFDGQAAADDGAVVDERIVEQVIAQRSDIPTAHLQRTDSALVDGLETRLRARVIGQDAAVESLAEAIRMRWVGLGDARRPVGVFLFVGPTGVGKTELARALAEELFGRDDKLSRLDMAEFAEAHTASKLLGAPPGYVGYDDGGRLAEAVRKNPHGVLLLDEIEKAHPSLQAVFLRILDEGQMLDSQGRELSFRNQIIIMTSNLGAGPARRRIGVGAGEDGEHELQARVEQAIAQHFAPEFRNRIDRTCLFRPFRDEAVLKRIAGLCLARHLRGLQTERDVTVDPADSVLAAVVARGASAELGARHLQRACTDLVVAPLAAWLVRHPVKSGARLRLAFRDQLVVECVDA